MSSGLIPAYGGLTLGEEQEAYGERGQIVGSNVLCCRGHMEGVVSGGKRHIRHQAITHQPAGIDPL